MPGRDEADFLTSTLIVKNIIFRIIRSVLKFKRKNFTSF